MLPGKPPTEFFTMAVDGMGYDRTEIVLIGDDAGAETAELWPLAERVKKVTPKAHGPAILHEFLEIPLRDPVARL